jgi:hypothetical protein
MPKATVRANAPALPKAARATSAAKSHRSSATAPAAAAPAHAFDLNQARANWQSTCAKFDAAEVHYRAMCCEMESAALAAAADRSKRLMAIYAQEDLLAGVLDKQDDSASCILTAPASAEALQLKLDVFRRLWAKERRENDAALNGGDLADVAAGIALDLLTLLQRGEAAKLAKALA